ncbi:MAG: hypothetical protein GTO51_01215 [Candidatus Latescibacteria bacterium]|nr:hypothetical protein [Candidatus Latescibacterota bacterium]NIM21619.1 hypothetical protein [Candidatus Latescibacterota bacterium]NIM64598.1 hypothetical protein [Candidatus Latescibacterota bacterium]NIO01113.1 hypothetical protein [Candidatus Latescibacterota bacterium]NIO27506.1 hypothetical protein [Candidatus Latescibacterota bacterium]
MRLYEYQAKRIFADHHIPCPRGILIETSGASEPALSQCEYSAVRKAQVLTGVRQGGRHPIRRYSYK